MGDDSFPIQTVTKQEYLTLVSGALSMMDKGKAPSILDIQDAVIRTMTGVKEALNYFNIKITEEPRPINIIHGKWMEDLKKMILVHDGVLSSTENAQLIDFGDEQKWVPLSVTCHTNENSIEVDDWWVEKEGLEGYAE